MSEIVDGKHWTLLPVNTRLTKPLLFLEVFVSLVLFAGGAAFVYGAFLRPATLWVVLPFMSMWFGIWAYLFWIRIWRWRLASRFKFFEEGLTVRRRSSIEARPWASVVKAEVFSKIERHGAAWHELILIFASNEKIKIPLTPFVKERSVCDAIVERIPVNVESPKVSLKDEWL